MTQIIADEEESFGRTLLKGIEQFKKIAAKAREEGRDVIDGASAFAVGVVRVPQRSHRDHGGGDRHEWTARGSRLRLRLHGEEPPGRENPPGPASSSGGGDGVAAKQRRGDHGRRAQVRARRQPDATIKAILTLDGFVETTESVPADQPIGIVLDRTSFYAESGGQVADVGMLRCPGGALAVSDAKVAAGFVLHAVSPEGRCAGAIKVGDGCAVLVDYDRRSKIAPNHTMTHVLNHALRAVLGDEVDQKPLWWTTRSSRSIFHAKDTPTRRGSRRSCARRCGGLGEREGGDAPEAKPAAARLSARLRRQARGPANAEERLDRVLRTADAEQFVLLSEEGIAKGIRRRARATAEAEAREARAACEQLSGQDLEREMGRPRRFRRRTARGSATR